MSQLEKFIHASDRVVDFNAYFFTLPQEDHTIHSFEFQRDEITHLWTSLRASYDDLLSKRSSIKEEINLESIKSKYFVAQNAYLKCLSKEKELLSSLKLNPVNTSEESGPVNIPVERFHLPPCDMKTF